MTKKLCSVTSSPCFYNQHVNFVIPFTKHWMKAFCFQPSNSIGTAWYSKFGSEKIANINRPIILAVVTLSSSYRINKILFILFINSLKKNPFHIIPFTMNFLELCASHRVPLDEHRWCQDYRRGHMLKQREAPGKQELDEWRWMTCHERQCIIEWKLWLYPRMRTCAVEHIQHFI